MVTGRLLAAPLRVTLECPVCVGALRLFDAASDLRPAPEGRERAGPGAPPTGLICEGSRGRGRKTEDARETQGD